MRALEHADVPAPSTITAILRRRGLLDPAFAGQPRAWQRFEHDAPNELWQMDFKGHVPCGPGRCHPLTVLDDHSRYSLTLAACADEQTETVRTRLIHTFRHYGLPRRLLVDNGPPWGTAGAEHDYAPLTIGAGRRAGAGTGVQAAPVTLPVTPRRRSAPAWGIE